MNVNQNKSDQSYYSWQASGQIPAIGVAIGVNASLPILFDLGMVVLSSALLTLLLSLHPMMRVFVWNNISNRSLYLALTWGGAGASWYFSDFVDSFFIVLFCLFVGLVGFVCNLFIFKTKKLDDEGWECLDLKWPDKE